MKGELTLIKNYMCSIDTSPICNRLLKVGIPSIMKLLELVSSYAVNLTCFIYCCWSILAALAKAQRCAKKILGINTWYCISSIATVNSPISSPSSFPAWTGLFHDLVSDQRCSSHDSGSFDRAYWPINPRWRFWSRQWSKTHKTLWSCAPNFAAFRSSPTRCIGCTRRCYRLIILVSLLDLLSSFLLHSVLAYPHGYWTFFYLSYPFCLQLRTLKYQICLRQLVKVLDFVFVKVWRSSCDNTLSCVSSLRRGYANLPLIILILVYVPAEASTKTRNST